MERPVKPYNIRGVAIVQNSKPERAGIHNRGIGTERTSACARACLRRARAKGRRNLRVGFAPVSREVPISVAEYKGVVVIAVCF